MLRARNLDDQSFDDIVAAAVGRLPWLCPQWTDHNAHDPGVTLIELMAWYKEMQQYHMNRFTDDMRRKLLALLGVSQLPQAPAACAVRPADPLVCAPRLTRLQTSEEIVFELTDAIAPGQPEVACCLVGGGDTYMDATALMQDLKISVQPFRHQNRRTDLLLGFDARPLGLLRLWFDVEEPEDCPRNPFTAPDQMPRLIRWSVPGVGDLTPRSDETHALSQDGYITFDAPESWRQTTVDGRTLYWLIAALEDPGCEDEARLCGVSARSYQARQQQTWSQPLWRTVEPGPDCRLLFDDALSLVAAFTVFVRTEAGWQQCADFTVVEEQGLRGVALDAGGAAADGQSNVLVVAADPIRRRELFFDSTGLPDQTIDLHLGGSQALRDQLVLICDTLCPDGVIRPQVWHCVDDFFGADKRSLAFTYDPLRETITFGDGAQGAVVPAGENAILAAGLVLSRCSGGNIPAGSALFAPGLEITHSAAAGGRDRETLTAASGRLLRLLEQPQRCVSAADYERVALQTPGLRVRAAKAIPGYDQSAASAAERRPVLTLVVAPYGADRQSMPNAAFLRRIREEVEKRRSICTVVRVTPPQYVGVGVSVQLKTDGSVTRSAVRDALEQRLAIRDGQGIGRTISRNDVMGALQDLPGVDLVRRLELQSLGPDCYISASGDGVLPPNGVPYLKNMELTIS